MKNQNLETSSNDIIESVTLSRSRGTKILNLLEVALAELQGQRLTYTAIAKIAGLSTSTVFDWAAGAQIRQVEALFRLLERLPRSKRTELLDRVCRPLPTIYHQRIGWRPRQISHCEQLLRAETGLTLIQGDENSRDFLVTALAHSATRLDLPRQQVYGIDVRLSDRFVPVDGITYVGGSLDPERVREKARSAWQAIHTVEKGIIFLNGVWHALNNVQKEILEITTRCHVVVGDVFAASKPESHDWMPRTTRFISVNQKRDRQITLNFQRPYRLQP